ncbi:MAG: hypothetical protein ACKO81_08600 [Planctomycetota bacterium]
MYEFPFGYERIQETSWAYLSSLLMLALFFKFNRFWAMRNLDLILLILLAPGLLMVYHGSRMADNTAPASISQPAPAPPPSPGNLTSAPAGEPEGTSGGPADKVSSSGQETTSESAGKNEASEAQGSELPATSQTTPPAAAPQQPGSLSQLRWPS